MSKSVNSSFYGINFIESVNFNKKFRPHIFLNNDLDIYNMIIKSWGKEAKKNPNCHVAAKRLSEAYKFRLLIVDLSNLNLSSLPDILDTRTDIPIPQLFQRIRFINLQGNKISKTPIGAFNLFSISEQEKKRASFHYDSSEVLKLKPVSKCEVEGLFSLRQTELINSFFSDHSNNLYDQESVQHIKKNIYDSLALPDTDQKEIFRNQFFYHVEEFNKKSDYDKDRWLFFRKIFYLWELCLAAPNATKKMKLEFWSAVNRTEILRNVIGQQREYCKNQTLNFPDAQLERMYYNTFSDHKNVEKMIHFYTLALKNKLGLNVTLTKLIMPEFKSIFLFNEAVILEQMKKEI